MNDLTPFLACTAVIDWDDGPLRALAANLRNQSAGELSLIRQTFEWVRDRVQHCGDFRRNELTCRASDVLLHGTGFCYAKSHLLAALLRANGIPTGFCYQRLSMDGNGPPYCLHGLNAVYLTEFGWFRLDARGNKDGVFCSFSPPTESLPFRPSLGEECDFLEIWAEPLPSVVNSLNRYSSVDELGSNLPDMTPSEMQDRRRSSDSPPIMHRPH